MSGRIVTAMSAQEYFKELLEEAIANQKVALDEMTAFYLVDLLSRFIDTEALYLRRPDGSLDAEPLAFILQRALEGDREERIAALRKLGDSSLYVAGFFSDSLSRSVVDVDYYVQMGGAAYGSLARLARARAGGLFGTLYAELGEKFIAIADLFSEISERASVTTNKGVVRLYERWVKTGSDRLTRLLAEQGVLPALVKPGMPQ